MKKPTLTDEDWNFTTIKRVPDNELVPCLLWEYLRESQTAWQLAQKWQELFTAADAAKRDQGPLAIMTQSLALKINHEMHFYDFLYRAVAMVSGFYKLAGVPWRKLHTNAKRFLCEPCENINPPVFIGVEMQVSELAADTARRLEEELAKIPSTTGPVSLEDLEAQPPLSIPKARAPLRFFKPPDSYCEAICVVVDWGRYDDKAIRSGLNKLTKEILETRPSGVEPQSRKGWGVDRDAGENSEWRGKLRDLGRARLHWYYGGAGHLQQANPVAHAWLADNLGKDKGDRAIGKSLSDGAARFKKAFWQILPFEKGKAPLSLTAVGRQRKISMSVPDTTP